MKPYQERVVEEKKQLELKIEKLDDFIGGETFETLVPGERGRLREQYRVMRRYCAILGERIEAFQ